MCPEQLDKEELDKLIALAKQPVPKSEQKDLDNVQQWAIDIGLKKGLSCIKVNDLWDCYKKWSNDPVPLGVFRRQLHKYIPKRKYVEGFYYLVDPSSFTFLLETEVQVLEREKEKQKLQIKRLRENYDGEKTKRK